MSTLAGLCLGVSLGILLCTPANEPREVGQLRAVVVMVFAFLGVALL